MQFYEEIEKLLNGDYVAEHTPGPWAIDSDGGGKPFAIVTSINFHWNNVDVCEVYGTDREGNARLISAAPDLLSAAKNAANVLAAIATGQLVTIGKDSHALQELRHALAKAEGRGA